MSFEPRRLARALTPFLAFLLLFSASLPISAAEKPRIQVESYVIDAELQPSAHKLVYMHYPLAEAAQPPPTAANYYQPLRDIRLPANTHFVAGFVHEKLSRDDNARILAAIEQARGRAVDVACSCGLGRRTPADAGRLLELMQQMAVS